MSTVQIEIWHLVTLLAMFVSVIASAGWMLLGQIRASLSSAEKKNSQHWDEKFRVLADEQQRGSDGWRNLERDFLKFRGDLPLEYVRREDFIRNQSVIEAKLDAVALHIQNLQLQRTLNHG